jgi:RNA polymerase sigma factor (sigma-70 family)
VTRDEKFAENVGLVHHVLKRFRASEDDYDDYYQVGCMGLLHAIDGFDESKGYKFSTYACTCIRGFVMTYKTRHGRAIKIPEEAVMASNAVGGAYESFLHKNHRKPTRTELAAELAVPVSSLSTPRVAKSIDAVDGAGFAISDLYGQCDDTSDIEIESLLSCLTDIERSIVKLKMAGESFASIARTLGISQRLVSHTMSDQIRPKLADLVSA